MTAIESARAGARAGSDLEALAASRDVPDERLLRALVGVAAACGLVFALGLFVTPTRTLGGLLTGAWYVLGIGLGAASFLALQHITKAGWSVAFRRVPEALCALVPLAALLLVPVALGLDVLYPWARGLGLEHASPGKVAWLSAPWFLARGVAIFAVWIGFVAVLQRASRAQDADGDPARTGRLALVSGLFLAALAVTYTVASMDWVQSLEPAWFSTIFALYHWSGAFVAGLAAMVLLIVALRERGPLRGIVGDAHLLDLGRLLFGFTTFWAYIWFSQYMLIWYANLPEETIYYLGRTAEPWSSLFYANLALGWGIPFLVLLPRSMKRSPEVLWRVAALVLVGRWLDLYLGVGYPLMPEAPRLGIFDLAPVIGALALGLWVFLRVFAAHAPVPARDPFLAESVHHHHA